MDKINLNEHNPIRKARWDIEKKAWIEVFENLKLIESPEKILYPFYCKLFTTNKQEVVVWWDSFTKVAVSIWRDIKAKNDSLNKEKIDEFNNLAIPPDIIVDVSTFEEKWNELYKYLANNFNWVAWINPHLGISYERKWPLSGSEILERIEMFGELWFGFIYIPPHINKDIISASILDNRLTTTSLSWWVIVTDMLKYWVDNIYDAIYPEILKIAKKYNIWVAIWWIFRPSNIHDSLDRVHRMEIDLQEKYIEEAINQNVSIIRQWPWHMPLSDIKEFVDLIKTKNDIPYMSLWPIVSDYISVWYDSYANVIGSYELWRYGKANIINWVTDEEHVGWIPKKDSSMRWYIAARISAYLINSFHHSEQIKSLEKDIGVMKNTANTCQITGSPIVDKSVFALQACTRCGVWSLCPCHIDSTWKNKRDEL